MDWIISFAVQEISANGLEGCTLSSLWRLCTPEISKWNLPFDDYIKQAMWNQLRCIPEIIILSPIPMKNAPPYHEEFSSTQLSDISSLPSSESLPCNQSASKISNQKQSSKNSKPTNPKKSNEPNSEKWIVDKSYVEIQQFGEAERLGIILVSNLGLRESALGLYESSHVESGLNSVMLKTLELLAQARHDGLTQAQLARSLGINNNNYFYVIRNLEVRGLIVRQTTVVRASSGQLPSHTNIIHLTRYAPVTTNSLNTSEKLESFSQLSRGYTEEFGDNLETSESLTSLDLVNQDATLGTRILESHRVSDDVSLMKAVCDQLDQTEGKVLVRSELKANLGFRFRSGHVRWRRLEAKLINLDFVKIFQAEIDGKATWCIRLLKPFDPIRLLKPGLKLKQNQKNGHPDIEPNPTFSKGYSNHAEGNFESVDSMYEAENDNEGNNEYEGDREEVQNDQIKSKDHSYTELCLEIPIERQIYDIIESAGNEGIYITEIFSRMGLNKKKNYYRINNLLASGLIISEVQNLKRTTVYCLKAKKYVQKSQSNTLTQQIKDPTDPVVDAREEMVHSIKQNEETIKSHVLESEVHINSRLGKVTETNDHIPRENEEISERGGKESEKKGTEKSRENKGKGKKEEKKQDKNRNAMHKDKCTDEDKTKGKKLPSGSGKTQRQISDFIRISADPSSRVGKIQEKQKIYMESHRDTNEKNELNSNGMLDFNENTNLINDKKDYQTSWDTTSSKQNRISNHELHLVEDGNNRKVASPSSNLEIVARNNDDNDICQGAKLTIENLRKRNYPMNLAKANERETLILDYLVKFKFAFSHELHNLIIEHELNQGQNRSRSYTKSPKTQPKIDRKTVKRIFLRLQEQNKLKFTSVSFPGFKNGGRIRTIDLILAHDQDLNQDIMHSARDKLKLMENSGNSTNRNPGFLQKKSDLSQVVSENNLDLDLNPNSVEGILQDAENEVDANPKSDLNCVSENVERLKTLSQTELKQNTPKNSKSLSSSFPSWDETNHDKSMNDENCLPVLTGKVQRMMSARQLDCLMRKERMSLGNEDNIFHRMKDFGYIPSRIIRAREFHKFLFRYVDKVFEKNCDEVHYVFSMNEATMVMPLELFFQIIGSNSPPKNFKELCERKLTLSDLTASELTGLIDLGSRLRVSYLLDILRRLQLISLEPGIFSERETEPKQVSCALGTSVQSRNSKANAVSISEPCLGYCLSKQFYIEKPSGVINPFGKINEGDGVRYDFSISESSIDAYWKALEECYSNVDHQFAKKFFPGSVVPEIYGPRAWYSSGIMPLNKRANLIECLKKVDPNQRITNQIRSIAHDLGVEFEFAFRTYYNLQYQINRNQSIKRSFTRSQNRNQNASSNNIAKSHKLKKIKNESMETPVPEQNKIQSFKRGKETNETSMLPCHSSPIDSFYASAPHAKAYSLKMRKRNMKGTKIFAGDTIGMNVDKETMNKRERKRKVSFPDGRRKDIENNVSENLENVNGQQYDINAVMNPKDSEVKMIAENKTADKIYNSDDEEEEDESNGDDDDDDDGDIVGENVTGVTFEKSGLKEAERNEDGAYENNRVSVSCDTPKKLCSRKKKVSWTIEQDRIMLKEYVKYRAQHERMLWNDVVTKLPYSPITCQKRLSKMRSEKNVRVAISSLVSLAAHRYRQWMELRKTNQTPEKVSMKRGERKRNEKNVGGKEPGKDWKLEKEREKECRTEKNRGNVQDLKKTKVRAKLEGEESKRNVDEEDEEDNERKWVDNGNLEIVIQSRGQETSNNEGKETNETLEIFSNNDREIPSFSNDDSSRNLNLTPQMEGEERKDMGNDDQWCDFNDPILSQSLENVISIMYTMKSSQSKLSSFKRQKRVHLSSFSSISSFPSYSLPFKPNFSSSPFAPLPPPFPPASTPADFLPPLSSTLCTPTPVQSVSSSGPPLADPPSSSTHPNHSYQANERNQTVQNSIPTSAFFSDNNLKTKKSKLTEFEEKVQGSLALSNAIELVKAILFHLQSQTLPQKLISALRCFKESDILSAFSYLSNLEYLSIEKGGNPFSFSKRFMDEFEYSRFPPYTSSEARKMKTWMAKNEDRMEKGSISIPPRHKFGHILLLFAFLSPLSNSFSHPSAHPPSKFPSASSSDFPSSFHYSSLPFSPSSLSISSYPVHPLSEFFLAPKLPSEGVGELVEAKGRRIREEEGVVGERRKRGFPKLNVMFGRRMHMSDRLVANALGCDADEDTSKKKLDGIGNNCENDRQLMQSHERCGHPALGVGDLTDNGGKVLEHDKTKTYTEDENQTAPKTDQDSENDTCYNGDGLVHKSQEDHQVHDMQDSCNDDGMENMCKDNDYGNVSGVDINESGDSNHLHSHRNKRRKEESMDKGGSHEYQGKQFLSNCAQMNEEIDSGTEINWDAYENLELDSNISSLYNEDTIPNFKHCIEIWETVHQQQKQISNEIASNELNIKNESLRSMNEIYRIFPNIIILVFYFIDDSKESGINLKNLKIKLMDYARRLKTDFHLNEVVLENHLKAMTITELIFEVNAYDDVHYVSSNFSYLYFIEFGAKMNESNKRGKKNENEIEDTNMNNQNPVQQQTECKENSDVHIVSDTNQENRMHEQEATKIDEKNEQIQIENEHFRESTVEHQMNRQEGNQKPHTENKKRKILGGTSHSDEGSCFSLPIRPWMSADGKASNSKVWAGLNRRILGLVALHPGIIEEDLIQNMRVLHPQTCKEVLGVLVDEGKLKVKTNQSSDENVFSMPSILKPMQKSRFQKFNRTFRHYYVNPFAVDSF